MSAQIVVLLASYNGAPWIAAQVASILTQAEVEVRLVISDDASDDTTVLELAKFLSDDRVTLLTHRSPTGSAAKNFFRLIIETDVANADFIAFADQDDIWDRSKLSRGCEQICREDASGYSCAVEAFWSDGRKVLLRQERPVNKSDYLFEGAGQGCTFILTAKFYSRVRTFLVTNPSITNEIHYHDWMIYALSQAWKTSWTFDRTSMVSYRQHSDNDTGARASVHGVAKRLKLIRTGWYRHQLLSIAALCKSAAPDNADVARWHEILLLNPGIVRKYRTLKFCLSKGGRRRRVDRLMLLMCIIAGWI